MFVGINFEGTVNGIMKGDHKGTVEGTISWENILAKYKSQTNWFIDSKLKYHSTVSIISNINIIRMS